MRQERNSALWGQGGTGGSRASALWGKGGRRAAALAAVCALAFPAAVGAAGVSGTKHKEPVNT